MKLRATILFLAIALIVGTGAYLLRQPVPPEPAAPAQTASAQRDLPPPVSANASTPQASEGKDAPPAEAQKSEPSNPFAVRTWEPPRPVAPVVTAPPPPQAPPLPFRFIGRVDDPDGGHAFMLTAGDRVLAVKTGDVLDGQYLVEAYRDGQLHFLYQPLNIRQTLFVGHDS